MSVEFNDISEVYWLLDRVLEDLGMVKQLLYDGCSCHEKLLLSSLLALSGAVNDREELNKLIKSMKGSAWRTREGTLSFYLGLLARNYIRKRCHLLVNRSDISNTLKDVNEKIIKFLNDGKLENVIDALFLEAVLLDLAVNLLDLEVLEFREDIKPTFEALDKCFNKAQELPFEYKVKAVYAILVFHEAFNKKISFAVLRRLLQNMMISLSQINIEYRAFLLRTFTALWMFEERQKILRSLADEYKSRFMYTVEKELVKRLVVNLLSEAQDKNFEVRYLESKKTAIVKISLSEDQMESLVKPNVLQLSLLALGLMISGYHRSYTLPFKEQRDYSTYTRFVRDRGEGKLRDIIRVLDKRIIDYALKSIFNEKVWPIFKKETVSILTLLTIVGVFSDYYLIPTLGQIAHVLSSTFLLSGILFFLLREVANFIHSKWHEALTLIPYMKKVKQEFMESFIREFYNKVRSRGAEYHAEDLHQ